MSIIKDAFKEVTPFWKKKEETKEERLAKLNKLEEELQYAKKQMMAQAAPEENKEMTKVIKVTKIPEPPKITPKPAIPEPEQEEQPPELTTEQRLAILEDNVLMILGNMDERLTALERAYIKGI
jgi:hypothetical protein